jgi:hypothetical protein
MEHYRNRGRFVPGVYKQRGLGEGGANSQFAGLGVGALASVTPGKDRIKYAGHGL